MGYLETRNHWTFDFVGKSSAGELKKNGIMLFGTYEHKVAVENNKYTGYDREVAMSKSNCGSWKLHETLDNDANAPAIAKFMMRMSQDMAKASTRTEAAPLYSVLILPNKS